MKAIPKLDNRIAELAQIESGYAIAYAVLRLVATQDELIDRLDDIAIRLAGIEDSVNSVEAALVRAYEEPAA